jgi:hypothetical protein
VGDGNTEPDWEITGDLTVDLRAERAGGGDGRIYSIVVECTDASGNSSVDTVFVCVPLSSSTPCTFPDEPAPVGSMPGPLGAGSFGTAGIGSARPRAAAFVCPNVYCSEYGRPVF